MSYTPQQNGIKKWRNWSLLDITWCFLMDKNLPQFLWGEAIHVVVIIWNLCSTKTHPNKTLEELFTNHKPWITKLWIFNSTIFVHQHPLNIGKLENHDKECILLNYDDHAQGYCCYQPFKCCVIISRNVKILENDHMDLDEILAFTTDQIDLWLFPYFFSKGYSSSTLITIRSNCVTTIGTTCYTVFKICAINNRYF